MRVAILDLGTNTFNLLIADVENEVYSTVFKSREIVKLGEGGLKQNKIGEVGYQRGISAIQNHIKRIQSHRCDRVKAVATSGIRSTSNGEQFMSEIKSKFDLDIELIDGDREAELIWKGIKQVCQIEENCLLMDIGGGSTEFIIANEDGIQWKMSYKLGASRLKENFEPSNPITQSEINKLNGHFETELETLKNALDLYPCTILLGSSGSFDTICEMYLHRINKHSLFSKNESLPIDLDGFQMTYDFLIRSTLQERLDTPGIVPMRADMIVVSVILTKYILKLANTKSLFVSKYALKEGLLSEF